MTLEVKFQEVSVFVTISNFSSICILDLETSSPMSAGELERTPTATLSCDVTGKIVSKVTRQCRAPSLVKHVSPGYLPGSLPHTLLRPPVFIVHGAGWFVSLCCNVNAVIYDERILRGDLIKWFTRTQLSLRLLSI